MDFANYTFSEKRYYINRKIDELIEMLIKYDQNNVGMSAPSDMKNVETLKKMKDEY